MGYLHRRRGRRKVDHPPPLCRWFVPVNYRKLPPGAFLDMSVIMAHAIGLEPTIGSQDRLVLVSEDGAKRLEYGCISVTLPKTSLEQPNPEGNLQESSGWFGLGSAPAETKQRMTGEVGMW